jgi:hypothetical protein
MAGIFEGKVLVKESHDKDNPADRYAPVDFLLLGRFASSQPALNYEPNCIHNMLTDLLSITAIFIC